MSEDTFTCAACGQTYEKSWSDEDVQAEARELWGDVPVEEQVVICDDCFRGDSGTFGYDLATEMAAVDHARLLQDADDDAAAARFLERPIGGALG